jgi:hypothetical protein
MDEDSPFRLDVDSQLLGLLGRIDHLGEQKGARVFHEAVAGGSARPLNGVGQAGRD